MVLRLVIPPFWVELLVVSNDPSLFDVPGEEVPEVRQEMPIRPEQVQEIRKAFDKAGILGQKERKELVNSVVVRGVTSLRELRAVEARRILTSIERRTGGDPKPKGSAWDDREEDTWIDKL